MSHTTSSIAWFFWDPPREVFTLPFIDHPIVWYGVLFVLGFILGYYISAPLFARTLRQIRTIATCDILDWPTLILELQKPESILSEQLHGIDLSKPIDPDLKQAIVDAINQAKVPRDDLSNLLPAAIAPVKQTSYFLVDRLCWFIVAGTIIGARLGYVFFYDWDRYKEHPLAILKTWEGGLASHGGAIGVLIALYLYQRYISRWYPSFSFLQLLDILCIPTALVAFFIRLGNFMNQEILGTPTTLPWGVVFGHAADGTPPLPRHPVQLYEGFAYLSIFVFLVWIWKTRENTLKTGRISGFFMTLMFSARFLMEFFKEQQDSVIGESHLQMGQYLSLPFIFLGLFLLYYSQDTKNLSK